MARNILAVVIGLFVGGAFNMGLIEVSHSVYPLPEDLDPNDFEAFRAHLEAKPMPTGALLFVLAAHSGGSLVSGFACGLIAMRSWYRAAIGLAAFWTCGGIFMLFLLPSPVWFAVTDILLYVPGALLGVKLGGTLRDRSAPPLETP
jgi:hypothetical protein